MPEQRLDNRTINGKSVSIHKKALDQLIAMTDRIPLADGRTPTRVPFLSIIKSSRDTLRSQGVLTPSFCLTLQGTKKLYLGQNIFQYSAGDYLASLIDMPASAQVIGATEESPYLALRIDFTTQEIASVVMEAEIVTEPNEKDLGAGTFIGKSDAELLDIFSRLLKLIDKPKEVRFLSELIKREMIFNLLSGDFGHLFFQKALFDQRAEGVGKAIQWIKENYARCFTVEELAKSCNMSNSGLHHKFKAITTMGPLQYQKQLRLQEARRLMLSGPIGATTAALTVGYESPSQFNREYRRLFGLPPLQDIKAMRKSSCAWGFEDG
ncbi:AraC-type DNA-binding protein [Paenibacillus sophorae]|uniref:AraC family transcriptional regulator n=1 Tax=Paenibacillus sophorae TaxID=1333845 RepID=A0A1H8VA76_9BACL|nr:AraC family transcriptional regulator [Paenibacillus sophorae]QWU13225.1 AraC family transcriptional regulator [Paenibacillus sophorae]SEP12203.1 AraC-type DNA-binding protein [Paenibacillus sophorae]